MAVIVWSFSCLRDGSFPRRRHDGLKLDAHRRETRQGRLPVRGLLREFRADWEELAYGLGFKPWSATATPCFQCSCTAENMHVYVNSEEEQPYAPHTNNDYRREVATALVDCRVGPAAAGVLQAVLRNEPGSRAGRFVSRDCEVNGVLLRAPARGLAGDRLEAIESAGQNCDVLSTLTDLPGYPARIVFFRQLPGTWVASLNVLFDVLTFEDIALDILHVVDLGVAQYCAAWAFPYSCWRMSMAQARRRKKGCLAQVPVRWRRA